MASRMLRLGARSGRLYGATPSMLGAMTSPRHSPAAVRGWRALSVRRRRYGTSKSPHESPPQTPPGLSESELLARLMRSQRVWWWLGAAVLGSVSLVAFGPELKLGVSRHTAEVASRSLQDETLQNNTRELASQIVQTVLNDPKVLDQASRFLQRLVVMDSTRDALRALVIHTLNDEQTRAQVSELTKHTVAALLQDPNTLRQVVELLRSLVVDPQAKESLLLLLEQLMRDEQTRANLTQLLAHTFLQDPVKQNVSRTLAESVHDVLSRGDIQNHAKEFVSGVVRDQTVQAQGGDAIWSTVMYALTPGWLSWMWEHPEDDLEDTSGPASAAEQVVKATMEAAEEEEKLKEKKAEAETPNDKENEMPTPSEVSHANEPLKLKHMSVVARTTGVPTSDLGVQRISASQGSDKMPHGDAEEAPQMPVRTRTKSLPPRSEPLPERKRESKTTSPPVSAPASAPVGAEFAKTYEERNWNGTGSGFL